MEEIKLSYMVESDIPFVLQMDGLNDDDYSWSEKDFLNIINEKSCMGKVCKIGGEVIAQTVCLLDETEINILKLSVTKDKRRQGVGTKIINQYKNKTNLVDRFKTITSVVKEKNLEGQLFLKENGFTCVDIVEKYFEDYSNGYQFSWTKQ